MSTRDATLEPRIETLVEKKLIGKRLRMSLADNRTGELWRSVMPRRREIGNTVTSEPYTDTAVFRNIFGVWLPASGYTLDRRPHFEVLGEKYKNADPNSEEEIWIPIK